LEGHRLLQPGLAVKTEKRQNRCRWGRPAYAERAGIRDKIVRTVGELYQLPGDKSKVVRMN
jgi:hypothetical protein